MKHLVRGEQKSEGMSFQEFVARRPVVGVVIGEGALIPLALLLAWLLGVPPWTELEFSLTAVAIAILGTAPMVALLWALSLLDLPWLRELGELLQSALRRIFERSGRGAIVLVALLAGFGEELLFRGVIQGWLAQHLPSELAIVGAALVFGLVHFLSVAYFLLATLVGVYLGVIYAVTGNLLIVCLIHALYDWMAIHYYLRKADDG